MKWSNRGAGTGSCCLLFGMVGDLEWTGTSSCCLLFGTVGDLEWTGVGSNAGHCLLHAMCCGLEIIAFGSSGGGPVLFVVDNSLVMCCFYDCECSEMTGLALGVKS